MRFSTKRWFTLREILLVVIVVSVGLMSVIVALTNGIKYVQKTRQRVIAINLAREGMEAIYQIRDTNWTRWAWVKDQCRLKIDPLTDEWEEWCMNDDVRFSTWNYLLQSIYNDWQTYFALTWRSDTIIDLSDGINDDEHAYALCQHTWYREACFSWETSTTSEGRYFRQIEWIWLYRKNSTATWGELMDCTTSQGECGDSSSKEFRFCSKVYYAGEQYGEEKICGAITNFKWE